MQKVSKTIHEKAIATKLEKVRKKINYFEKMIDFYKKQEKMLEEGFNI